MAKIPKSGIANAQTIQASHITNIIEALDGTGSYDVVATGSFTGSFTGDGSNITGVTAEWDGTHVGNAEITGSLILTGDVTASSYTGSFVGDGSGLDGVVATTLFALSEGSGVSAFTFDGTSTQTINISGSVGLTTDTITKWTGDAFADTSITDDGAVVDINSDTTVTGSLTLTNDLIARNLEPTNDIFLNQSRTLYLDGQSVANAGIYSDSFANGEVIIYSGSTQIEIGYNSRPQVTITNANLSLAGNVTASSYTGSFVGDGSEITGVISSSYAITASYALNGGGGSDTNFANTNLTFDGNREHDTNGNYFQITTDAGAYGQGYFYMQTDGLNCGVGDRFMNIDQNGNIRFESASLERLSIDNGHTIINRSSADIDFSVRSSTNGFMLFVDGGTNRVGIGKNSPNAPLDVNGNAIVSGSLVVTSRIDGTTRTVKDSITINNNTSISGNPTGSGVYPGMIVGVDLSQSTTNTIRFTLEPIANYDLGARFEFYLTTSPGTSAVFRVDTDGVATYQGNFLAVANPFATSGTTRVSNTSGGGGIGDRIIITKISSDYWALEGAVKDGSLFAAS
jgi:hypothetical protein